MSKRHFMHGKEVICKSTGCDTVIGEYEEKQLHGNTGGFVVGSPKMNGNWAGTNGFNESRGRICEDCYFGDQK